MHLSFLLSYVAVVAHAIDATQQHHSQDLPSVHNVVPRDLLSLGFSPKTEIFFPTDKNWTTETTQRYTIHDAPTYVASIKPATEADVQKVVNFCSTFDIPFLATNGGHGFSTTFGRLHHGIEIDLGFFESVSVDAEANLMTIGGGTHFYQVFEPLYKAGKEIQTGSCACIGMMGATLGGGTGRYNGIHGLIIDALHSVRIVLANGTTITASESRNAELFWGIRGAGMNFGVIVSATYNIHDLTSSTVVNADIDLPLDQGRKLMEYINSFGDDVPRRLANILLGSYSAQNKTAYFTLNLVYIGSLKDAQQYLRPVIDHMTIIRSNVSEVSWNGYLDASFWGEAPKFWCSSSNYNLYSLALKRYDIDALVSMFGDFDDFIRGTPGTENSVFYFEPFATQAVKAVPNNATAYPHRDLLANLQFNFNYPAGNSTLENTVNNFAVGQRTTLQKTSGFKDLQVYVSYGHGDESSATLYGAEKLPRLKDLKAKFDPKNVFRFNNPFV